MSDVVRRFRGWLAYERGAHVKMLSSLQTVPPEATRSDEYRRALDLFDHIVGARLFWLHRFGELEGEAPELFPEGRPVEEIMARAEDMCGRWTRWLDEAEEADLERVIEYEATEGGRWRSRVEDVLVQLFGHSWYHRGQIAAIVRRLGGTPAGTDYVFVTRERAD